MKTNTWKELAKIVNVSYNYIKDIRKGRHLIRLDVLRKICDVAKVKLDDVEKNIIKVGSGGSIIHNFTLPITITKELAGLVAHGFGDGHIDKKYTFHYCNSDEVLQERVVSFILKTFNLHSFYVRFSSYNVPVRCYPFIVGYVLNILGVPKGNKTLQEFLVPSWLIHTNKACKRIFLRELFSDEGAVHKDTKNKRRRSISIAFSRKVEYMNSLKLFLEILRRMLLEFNIKSREVTEQKRYKDKEGREKLVLGFDITGFRNLSLFKKEIGFSSPSKNADLDFILGSFQMNPANFTRRLILENLQKTTKPKTTKEITEEIGKAYSTTKKYIRSLYKEGKVTLCYKLNRKNYWTINDGKQKNM
ncbi:MAG: LAGLIDADG family homing endonuclease [Candidatus Aenigmarchaeota archaeon]|nr:LAGLIDADG family homing endonuclease [Candidatus Aenigmarchaeota archaeon]